MKWKLKTLKRIFLPAACMETTNNEDFKSIVEHAAHFEGILVKPMKRKQKFVAQFENGKASVGLQFIQKDHPLQPRRKRQYCIVLYGSLR
jgi:aspartokinase/homoserine dehydrogenase 1